MNDDLNERLERILEQAEKLVKENNSLYEIIEATTKIMDAATDKIAELEAQKGWKPIAEMPEELKDGRMVLGYSKIESPSWFFMHWSDFKDSSIVACDGFWFCGIHTKKPTHYMQIPEVDDAL